MADHDHCDHDPIECSYEALRGEYDGWDSWGLGYEVAS